MIINLYGNLIGGYTDIIKFLFCVMAIEVITTFIITISNRPFCINNIKNVINKNIAILILIIMANALDFFILNSHDFVRYTISCSLIGLEVNYVVKNFHKLGIDIPNKIVDTFSELSN